MPASGRNLLQGHQVTRRVLPRLHLTVDDTGILSRPVDVMHLGDEACIGDRRMQDVVYVDWFCQLPVGWPCKIGTAVPNLLGSIFKKPSVPAVAIV